MAPAYLPELGLTTFDRTFTLADATHLTIADVLALQAPAPLEWHFQVEGELSPAGENEWLLRQGEVTVRIRLVSSVPVTSEVGTLPQKGNPPFLRVVTHEPVATAALRTEIVVE